MDDNGDAVQREGRSDKAGGLFLILQSAAGKTDVAAAFGDGGDAGAGAGGVVGKADAVVILHELLTEGADHLFHRGRAVGRNTAGFLLCAASQRGDCQHQNECKTYEFFHFFFSFVFILF